MVTGSTVVMHEPLCRRAGDGGGGGGGGAAR